MPISATGRAEAEAARAGSRGFTLVELLVVMTILGLLSAAVVLALPDSRGSLVAEAERFAARTKAAQERAVIGGRATAVRVTSAGYGFDLRARGEWQPISERPFVDEPWKTGTQPLLPGEGAVRVAFDAAGMAEPLRLELAREGERVAVDIARDGDVRVVR